MSNQTKEKTEIRVLENGVTKINTTARKHINKLVELYGEEAFEIVIKDSNGVITELSTENLKDFEFDYLLAQ